MSERDRDELALAGRVAKADRIIHAFAVAYIAFSISGSKKSQAALARAAKRAVAYGNRYLMGGK